MINILLLVGIIYIIYLLKIYIKANNKLNYEDKPVIVKPIAKINNLYIYDTPTVMKRVGYDRIFYGLNEDNQNVKYLLKSNNHIDSCFRDNTVFLYNEGKLLETENRRIIERVYWVKGQCYLKEMEKNRVDILLKQSY